MPGSSRPIESDTKILAYYLWEGAGKPNGRDKEFYYMAENYLIKLANAPNYNDYLDLIYQLRGSWF